MRTLLLLLSVGLCCCLQPGVQYKYHYRARVTTGIPEVNERRTAAVDVRADLKVYAPSAGRVIFKLENVEYGTHNGFIHCDAANNMDQPLPVEYQLGGLPLGQREFAVDTSGSLTFSRDEEVGTVNFYKGIMQLFFIVPLKETFFGLEKKNVYNTSYVTTDDKQDSVMGDCKSTYTQHPLRGIAAAEHEHFILDHVENDCQLPPDEHPTTNGCPSIHSSSYKLIKSINLENCAESVEFQYYLNGLQCSMASDQCNNLYSRNSHGTYYLRGDHNGMRIEKAETRGTIIVSPFGYETEHLISVSQQKVALVSVTALGADDVPHMNYAITSETTLNFKMVIPESQSVVSRTSHYWAKAGGVEDFTRDILGLDETTTMDRATVQSVIALINEVVPTLEADGGQHNYHAAVAKLDHAAIISTALTPDSLNMIINELPAKHREYMYSILGAMGTNASIQVLLDVAGNMTDFKQVMVFGFLNHNLKLPESLRPLLDFVKSLDLDATPFKTSQIILNFATLVKRMCGARRPNKPRAAHDFMQFHCTDDNIVADFQQFLITSLDTADTFWKQMVLVKSLVNLQTTEAQNAVLPLLLGEKDCDPTVRSVAMDALASWNAAHREDEDKITLLLLDIFENPSEKRELRSRALGYLSSWQLSSTAWTRLAYSTHRPGLRDLAALTYSLIKATSEYEHPGMVQQRQFAQHALAQARPATNAQRYSSFRSWVKYCFADQIGAKSHRSNFKDPLSPLPSELAIYMQHNLGGVIFHKSFDFMISNDDGDLEMIAIDIILGEGRPTSSSPEDTGPWSSNINMLKADLMINEKVRAATRGLMNLMAVSGMELFVPFEPAMLQDAIASISTNPPYFGSSGICSLYIVPFESYFMTTNDLGLTVLTSHVMPTVFMVKGDMYFDNAGNDSYQFTSESASFTYGSKLYSHLGVMIPWAKQQIGTGISTGRSINLPVSPSAQLLLKKRDHEPASVTISLTTHIGEKVNLLSSSNTPYTIVRNSSTTDFDTLEQLKKTIYVSDYDESIYKLSKPLPFNFNGQYEGDAELKMSNLMDVFNGGIECMEKLLSSPTAKYHSAIFSLDLSNIEVGTLKLNFSRDGIPRSPNAGKFVSIYGQDRYANNELCGVTENDPPSLTTDRGSTNAFFDESLSPQTHPVEFDTLENIINQQQSVKSPPRVAEPHSEIRRPSRAIKSAKDPQLQPLLDYLRKSSGWEHAIGAGSARAELSCITKTGEKIQHSAEILRAETTCNNVLNQQNVKKTFAFAIDKMPHYSFCLDMVVELPKVNDLDTLATLSAKNLTRYTRTEFYTGAGCKKHLASSVETNLISDSVVTALINELREKESCSASSNTELLAEFLAIAQYDVTILNQTLIHDELTSQYPVGAMLTSGYRTFFERGLKMKVEIPPYNDKEKYTSDIELERTTRNVWKVTHNFNDGPSTSQVSEVPNWMVTAYDVSFFANFKPADYCVIDDYQVLTFDGLKANITVGDCPILLSTPCEQHQEEAFVIGVKRSRQGGLAVNIASEYKQLVINMDADGVVINDELMDPELYVKTVYYEHRYKLPSRHVAANVYKRNGYYKLEVVEDFDIILKEGKVYIKVADRLRGYLCGLCGNMDLEPSNDLVCPKNCPITDPDNFSKAWTPSSVTDCLVFKSPEDCLAVNQAQSAPSNYYGQFRF